MRDSVKVKIIAGITTLLGIAVGALQINSLVVGNKSPSSFYLSPGASVILSIMNIITLSTTFRVVLILLPDKWHKDPKVIRLKKFLVLDLTHKANSSKTGIPLIPIIVTTLNVFSMCVSLALCLNVSFLEWMVEPDTSMTGPEKAIKGIVAASLLTQIMFVTFLVIALWWPALMFTGCLIAIVSTLQYLTTISTILLNFNDQYPHISTIQLKRNQIFVCLSLFLACPGFVGYALLVTVTAHNRLSNQTSRLTYFYIFMCSVSLCLCIAWLGLSIDSAVNHTNAAHNTGPKSTQRANPVFASFGIVCDVICIVCATRLLATPRTKLKVQEYDLLKLNEHELDSWAALIDAYSANNSADVAKGKEALDLMKAYVNSPMPGFKCRVLRVYDDHIADVEAQAMRSYDEIKAWKTLDDISVFRNSVSRETSSVASTVVPTASSLAEKPMSKNAIKKAQKKNAKKNKTKDIATPDFHEKSPEEIEREQQFRVELVSTEGLILLTTIDNYDLTSPVKGRLGRILRLTLGGRSWLKPLCVRFGILGTHWPFRQMVFYTAPTKKPTARTAAFLASVSSWNNSLPCSQRCSLIYNPCYGSSHNEKALEMSGWTSTHGSPSHVIDLRAHKGHSLTEYLKSIKYRNQATAFKNANGQVIETDEFSAENCEIAMKLWANIAEKRTSEGHTAVLKTPTPQFLESLGKSSQSYRKLLFLKVGDDYIASCVLFFLGNTITSDIQGLDHDKARQYKAYFVMMQETITIALRQDISFVDFGPTTAKPKMDIGCCEIPLLGGVKAKKPLATMIGLCADKVDV